MEWSKSLVDQFVANKDKLFGSVKLGDHKFTISKLKIVDGKAVRLIEKNANVYGPVVCGTGVMKGDPVSIVMKQVDKDGKGNVEKKQTLSTNCMFTDLLMREEHECFWVTPEELSILFDVPKNRDKIKAEFKK
jgi:hypothetical protein